MLCRALSLGLILLLGACAAYTAVPPSRVQVKDAMTVETGIAWAKVNYKTPDSVIFAASGPVETWTIDGEPLDSIVFFAGVADGQPLLTLPEDKGRLSPFTASMTPNDIMDLFEAMLTKATGSAVARSYDLRPAKFGGLDGFRFEVDYSLNDDVDRRLSAIGVVRGGKLYLIAFQGTALYHYKKYLPEFEKIVASASLTRS